jgi:hypothetical protein
VAEPIHRAISIRQPYVELIFRGIKKLEYRSKPISIFGPVYIYAALKPADDPAAWRKAKAKPGEFPTGAIVGSVEIVGCGWDRGVDRGVVLAHVQDRRQEKMGPHPDIAHDRLDLRNQASVFCYR